MPVRLSLRIISTPLSLVLGYPFLARFTPQVDWKRRVLYIRRRNQKFVIPAFPPMECYIVASAQTHLLTRKDGSSTETMSGSSESDFAVESKPGKDISISMRAYNKGFNGNPKVDSNDANSTIIPNRS